MKMGTWETRSINWDKMFHRYETIMAGNDDSLRVQVTMKLGHMSKLAPESILASAVPVLVELLSRPFDNQSPSIQEAAAYCLKRVAFQGEGRLAVIIGQCGAIPPLLSLLQTSEGRLLEVILKCLRNLVTFSDGNRLTVARDGGLIIILRMLDSSSSGIRRPLLEILSALSFLREARRVIFNSGRVGYLVESVRCGSMISRTRAAQAIGLLGLVKQARGSLVRFGALEALLALIQDGDTSVKLVASNAIGVISSHVDHIRPVAQAGAIPIFAEILEGCEEPMGKEIVEDVFCILAVVEENAVEIFQHLVRILRGSNNEAKATAADIIWDLASYKHLTSVMQNSGAIPILVELLRDGTEDIKEKVSGAVAQLSYEEAARHALADSGAIPLLTQLLETESPEMIDNAAEALMRFAEDPSFSERICSVISSSLLRNVRGRLMQMRESEAAQLDSSLRDLSIQHLAGDPSLGFM
ncbi:OLC1v1022545C4 [Oldenlandia corymbosa var. corymbosa]|uniref:OLC1v1022545C4 n=1 Tax=Oldenlandia corymbosa var. corymbosa TaxID=529605 RepID=A0AAV1C1S6_OLDCO|nr:OLC1v1022545C4 [Oldenlandia corymbosa var. corymbosa]